MSFTLVQSVTDKKQGFVQNVVDLGSTQIGVGEPMGLLLAITFTP